MAAIAVAAEDDGSSTHTQGKHNFYDVYNAPDACGYMREMKRVQYLIGDYSSAIAIRTIESLFGKAPQSEGSMPPVVLELCAGYGLSMAPIRTTLLCTEVISHYVPERPALLEDALAADHKYFSSAARKGLPKFCSVGADVAGNALSYGKSVGLFDDIICRNLEEDPATESNVLSAQDVALCSRARLVIATGAFSYITTATLGKVVDCCPKQEGKASDGTQGDNPVFLFFPLVATKVDDIIAFFESRGLEVYYKPALHWLPQRRFSDEAEAATVEASQTKVLEGAFAAGRPAGALEGHLHATPLIAGPPSLGLAALAPQWIS